MLRSRITLVAALSALLFPAVVVAQQPVPAPAPVPKVLVFPFAALGDEARANAELLRKNLINAIDGQSEVDALDPASAERLLGKPLADARDACGDDDLCTTALGRAVGARYLVKGGLLFANGAYTLNLQLFDVDAGRVTKGPESQRVTAAPGEDPAASAVQSMRRAAAWLFATTATLTIETNVADAEILINSRKIAWKTPLNRPITVSVGKIAVRAQKDGHDADEKTIEIRPGAPNRVELNLTPRKPIGGAGTGSPSRPLVKRPLFWGAVAAGVLAVGAGAAVAASQSPGKRAGDTDEVQGQDTFTLGVNPQ